MKTLADLKRAMCKGSRWECEHISGWNPGAREIVKVGSNYVEFLTNKNGKLVGSRVDFPKAKDIQFNGEWVEFWGPWYRPGSSSAEYLPFLKYRKVS